MVTINQNGKLLGHKTKTMSSSEPPAFDVLTGGSTLFSISLSECVGTTSSCMCTRTGWGPSWRGRAWWPLVWATWAHYTVGRAAGCCWLRGWASSTPWRETGPGGGRWLYAAPESWIWPWWTLPDEVQRGQSYWWIRLWRLWVPSLWRQQSSRCQ